MNCGLAIVVRRTKYNKARIAMLKQLGLLLLVFSLTLPLMAQSEKPPANLEQYQWQNRLLLIFADTDSNEYYKKQIREFDGHIAGFQERDLKVFHLFAQSQSRLGNQPLDKNDVLNLYQKSEVEQGDFSLILIGKDGTEKLRSLRVLPTSKLFSRIDAMPMRQNEMQQEK